LEEKEIALALVQKSERKSDKEREWGKTEEERRARMRRKARHADQTCGRIAQIGLVVY
jgi:hypothetical protein